MILVMDGNAIELNLCVYGLVTSVRMTKTVQQTEELFLSTDGIVTTGYILIKRINLNPSLKNELITIYRWIKNFIVRIKTTQLLAKTKSLRSRLFVCLFICFIIAAVQITEEKTDTLNFTKIKIYVCQGLEQRIGLNSSTKNVKMNNTHHKDVQHCQS